MRIIKAPYIRTLLGIHNGILVEPGTVSYSLPSRPAGRVGSDAGLLLHRGVLASSQGCELSIHGDLGVSGVGMS